MIRALDDIWSRLLARLARVVDFSPSVFSRCSLQVAGGEVSNLDPMLSCLCQVYGQEQVLDSTFVWWF
jgi:hypothetical protein